MTDITEPIDHAAEAKKALAEPATYNEELSSKDALISIAHSLIELTGLMQHLAVPSRYVLNNCVEPNDVDEAIKVAMRRSAQTTQRMR